MITVSVKFFGQLRDIVNEKGREMTFTESTVSNLIELLIKEYGDTFRNAIIDPATNELADSIILFVNGRNIKSLQGICTVLLDQDLVSIFPPSGGG
jgi:molybdopterin synthase sulfur carrier subunit